MHTMIPDLSAEDRRRSLGWLAIWWIETFTVIGRGAAVGQTIRHSPEYMQFIANCYALNANGRRRFNRASLWRPKGCNKSGLGAEIAMFEALGPCRFDHWAEPGETYTFLGCTYYYMEGEPVGRPVQQPSVLCIATAEDQSSNVFDSIYYNCTQGPLSQLSGMGLDAGRTRIELPEGGIISPSTSGASSKDGGLQTFIDFDETHLFNTPALRRVFKTLQRNLPKRSLTDEPWLLEMTTFFRPGENSVAEDSYKYAEDILQGRIKHYAGLYFDHRYANLPIEEFGDEKKLIGALHESYGSAAISEDGKDHIILPDGRMQTVGQDGRSEDGWSLKDPGVEPGPSKDGWVDVHDIAGQIYQPDSDPNDSIRYYLNSRASSEDAWLTESQIERHLVHREEMEQAANSHELDGAWKRWIDPDEEITLGFDGSVSNDSTALVGCRVRDGMIFLIRLAQAPEGAAAAGWHVDRDAFDATARTMFDNYNVVGCYADAAYFESIIQGWERDYGDRMSVYARGNSYQMRFYTNNWSREMYRNLENAHTSFSYEPIDDPDEEPDAGQIRLLADPRLVDHFRNARRRDRSFGYLIFKDTPKSPHKIDACMAGLLAYSAREAYIAQPTEEQTSFVPIRIG